MKEVILITGATGFLGCHLAQLLVNNNYKIVATKRNSSNLKNCIEFQEKVRWINVDEKNWRDEIIELQPEIIIHAAWTGLLSFERNNWQTQSTNLLLLQDLLYIAEKSNTKKMIGLGSQAEYGNTDTVVSESHTLRPKNAYGVFKILSSQLLRYYCEINEIEWYWLRIFSVFGEKEAEEWLLPSIITSIITKKKKSMAFSPGDQQYAYLYVKDFAKAINKVIAVKDKKSGYYNISSVLPLPLKLIITLIRDTLDPQFILEFGGLPYRQDQSMLIAGNMTLYDEAFGTLQTTPLDESINNTINYYISKLLNESI